MPTFRETEKQRYDHHKSSFFSADACQPGIYKNIARPFCLPEYCAAENLHESVRDEALTYFNQRHIHWHDGVGSGLPSNHLCCSQSACVNTLWPLTRDADLLAAVFKPFFPEFSETLPFTADEPLSDGTTPYLVFEWIGMDNYLGEVGKRQRGANATSADFGFRFRRQDGRMQLVLGEWKYTESYGKKLPARDAINPTRLKIYRSAFDRWASDQPNLPVYESLFIEPFYQLMRQTLLAREIECKRHDGPMHVDIASVVHISPRANEEFAHSFTSESLRRNFETVTSAWQAIAPEGRFTAIASEDLLQSIERVAPPYLHTWRDWLLLRYGWWRGNARRQDSAPSP